MALETEIPMILVVVATVISLSWYVVRDNRERMTRIEKELCSMREFITQALTEINDRQEKHERSDAENFREIAGSLGRLEGRRRGPL